MNVCVVIIPDVIKETREFGWLIVVVCYMTLRRERRGGGLHDVTRIGFAIFFLGLEDGVCSTDEKEKKGREGRGRGGKTRN